MRAAKAGTCSYQQLQHCSTVGSTSCLVAVDVCLAILSCMGSWEMFQVLFIISHRTKLRIKECRNSTGLAQPLENRWVTHSSVSNSAFGRGWTLYPSEVFSVPISYSFCLKKKFCALPFPVLWWPSLSVLPQLFILALLSNPKWSHCVCGDLNCNHLLLILSSSPGVSLPWSSCPEVCSLSSGSQPSCQVPFPGSILIPTFLRFLHSQLQTSHIDTVAFTSYQIHLPAIPTKPVPASSS